MCCFCPPSPKCLAASFIKTNLSGVRIVELIDALDRERCWQTLDHFNQALEFLVRALLFRDIHGDRVDQLAGGIA